MNALVLLLALASTIVLRSGDRIAVEGGVKEENGVVTFRSDGRLYSMPASEVERIERSAAQDEQRPVKRLRVSEEERKRLIAELEKNHSGTPPAEQKILKEPPPTPSRTEVRESRREENEWRNRARRHEEAVRRASEELELLRRRADELRSQIHGFLSLGFRPSQFSYQTTQLARTEERIPYAELSLARAVRAYDEFRDEARREGVLPGWLR